MQVFSNTFCLLSEGPLWHPERCELFWFDISSKKLFSKGETERFQAFDEMLSASGWVDYDTLLIASETALWRCDILTERQDLVVSLESNNEKTRSNDGRADPQGGFWIRTMGGVFSWCRDCLLFSMAPGFLCPRANACWPPASW